MQQCGGATCLDGDAIVRDEKGGLRQKIGICRGIGHDGENCACSSVQYSLYLTSGEKPETTSLRGILVQDAVRGEQIGGEHTLTK